MKKLDLKNRKTKMISKSKIVSMVNLFEQYVDEEIELIHPKLSQIWTESGKKYDVNIQKNKVEEIYPDYDFD